MAGPKNPERPLAALPAPERSLSRLDPEQLFAIIASTISIPLPPGVLSPSSLPDDEESGEEMNAEGLASLTECLARIEATLTLLVQQRTVKDWYSTSEVAQILGKAEFTVREWCRLGRVHAAKRPCGRGKAKEWAVSHAELERIRNEGLLPL